MDENNTPEVLYLAPTSSARSALADYSRSFLSALEQSGRLSPMPFFITPVPEKVDKLKSPVSLLRRWTLEILRDYEAGPATLLHVELGRNGQREYWGGIFASRRLREAPYCLVLHNPPHLPDPIPLPPIPKGNFFERFTTNLSNIFARWARERLEKPYLEKAAALLVLSRRGGELLAEAYPQHRQKIAYLPPMPVGRFPEKFKRQVKKKSETIYVTYYGFIRPGVGLENFIRALSLLHKDLSLLGRTQVRIHGIIPQKAQEIDYHHVIMDEILKGNIDKVVEFNPGPISEAELNDLLINSDIILLPDMQDQLESASQVLLRSEGWAVAPVGPRTYCTHELVEDREDGMLYNPGDTLGLVECLEKLMTNQEMLASIQNKRYQRALERQPSKVAELMLHFYRETLRARDENRPVIIPEEMRIRSLYSDEEMESISAMAADEEEEALRENLHEENVPGDEVHENG